MVLSWQTGSEKKTGDHFPQPSSFSFSILSIVVPRCPPDFLPLSLTPHLLFTSHLILSPPNPPSPSPMSLPISPDRFAYLNRSRSVLAQHKAKANPPLPLPFPQPPHSPKGGDRALPSDYTVGEGLDYSPEGRQLSISDNCRERDTHACVRTHPPFLTLLLLR